MPHPTLIGVGALIHSATLGLIAIAAATRGHGLVLVDARVCIDDRGARTLTGVLRNAGASSLPARDIDLLLLDRRGRTLTCVRTTTVPLAVAACCDVRAQLAALAAVRFRFQLAEMQGATIGHVQTPLTSHATVAATAQNGAVAAVAG